MFYAAADYQTVTTLAKRAGAVRAMQLDINPEWPTLITYANHGGLADDRDFFTVYRRMPGPVSVPFN